VDDDWYGLVITDRTLVDQTDVAAWVNPKKKLFAIGSNSTDILDSGVSSDIASVIQAAENERAFVLFHEDADLQYPEAAWVARGFSYDPGEATWMFKTLTGFTASTITDAQRAAAFAKNANLYETYGSSDVTRNGNVGYAETTGADYIDVTRGIDWLEADMSERVFDLLADAPKIAYTDAGLAQIEGEVRASLDVALDAGLLRADPDAYSGQAYRVTIQKVADISASERAARNVPSDAVTFDAKLAGAIHSVEISGVVAI